MAAHFSSGYATFEAEGEDYDVRQMSYYEDRQERCICGELHLTGDATDLIGKVGTLTIYANGTRCIIPGVQLPWECEGVFDTHGCYTRFRFAIALAELGRSPSAYAMPSRASVRPVEVEEISLAELTAMLGAPTDGASVRFDGEGGFSVEPSRN